jgi:hypothetical protein
VERLAGWGLWYVYWTLFKVGMTVILFAGLVTWIIWSLHAQGEWGPRKSTIFDNVPELGSKDHPDSKDQ